MSIKVESSTDSKEAVAAANAVDASKESTSGQNPSVQAGDESAGETTEDSETQAETESRENDSTDENLDPDDQGEEGEETPAKPKKRNGFTRRVAKLNRAKAAAEAERDYWKNEALKANGTPKPEPTVEKKANQLEGKKPKPEAFESHDEYVEALVEWKADQKIESERQKSRERSVKTEYQQTIQSFQTKAKEFAKSHKDYEEVISEVDDVILSPALHDLILESELGPELQYALSKNREELERINALPYGQAARAIGRFETTLIKPSTESKVETKTTKAPAPIKPLGTGGTGAAKKSLSDPNISQRDYERLRDEEQRRAQRA